MKDQHLEVFNHLKVFLKLQATLDLIREDQDFAFLQKSLQITYYPVKFLFLVFKDKYLLIYILISLILFPDIYYDRVIQ